jgi:hypothetical protein
VPGWELAVVEEVTPETSVLEGATLPEVGATGVPAAGGKPGTTEEEEEAGAAGGVFGAEVLLPRLAGALVPETAGALLPGTAGTVEPVA